jgi:hypothetical protein
LSTEICRNLPKRISALPLRILRLLFAMIIYLIKRETWPLELQTSADIGE